MYAIADTHAVIWYLLADSLLSEAARNAFFTAAAQADPIGVSSISIVEIIYLTEKQRIPQHALTLLEKELQTPESVLTIVALDAKLALGINQVDRLDVPEMPDRIIAATAAVLDLPLITRDRKIRATNIRTIW
jgi:PIN domain nuclease of toxin-antitoxin system